MSCYHPLKAFILGTKLDGKKLLKVTDFKVDHLEYSGLKLNKIYDDLVTCRDEDVRREYIQIPCGRCIGCRLDYARVWSERLLAEKETSSSALFLTLTYCDDKLKENCFRIVQNKDSVQNGDIEFFYSLNKRDLQLFWKRLRKRFPDCKLRYFCCGEYGSKTMRPHYHAMVFNLPVSELNLKPYKRVRGNQYFNSEVIEDVWQNGYVVIGDFSVNSASYVARYTMKKAYDSYMKLGDIFDVVDDKPLCDEFLCMSRKPGIGFDWLVKNRQKMIDYQSVYVGDVKGSHRVSLNRYFMDNLGLDDEALSLLKENRKAIMESKSKLKEFKTDLDYLEYLAVEESNRKDRIKSLRRDDC